MINTLCTTADSTAELALKAHAPGFAVQERGLLTQLTISMTFECIKIVIRKRY